MTSTLDTTPTPATRRHVTAKRTSRGKAQTIARKLARSVKYASAPTYYGLH